ncbi:DUF2846 domain-containing protein [Amphritea sp. HPY]|uniref:DUF2846 domain-containing protein n=1 Tax=Amphritea sp. HPY TaxID=3421652 RepID=UPI003D7CF5FC
MKKIFIATAVAASLLSGCASVPMDTPEKAALAKQFNPPTEGHSGLYIYRDSVFGAALKKDVWVDGKCIGETAPKIFFYEEVTGGEEHQISTESEFSPNDLLVKTESGKNYFVNQYIKMGAFVGGANVELVDENTGKQAVAKLDLAMKGICSK